MINELDDFKSAWKSFGTATQQEQYSIAQLQVIVRKQSGNELAKIRRKIMMEWSIALLLSAAMVMLIHFCNKADTLYAIVFLTVILGISFFPYIRILSFKFQQINDLKGHLRCFLAGYEMLVSQYIKLSTILLPVAGAGGFLLGFHCTSTAEEWAGLFKIINLIWFIAFLGLISAGGRWIQKRYFNWIYGRNIIRLKDCLTELESEEPFDDK